MTCGELRDSYELFALGVADAPERDEICAHLDRRCEICVAGVRDARRLTALLGAAAPEAAPSKALRGRILASVGFERRRFSWAPVWAAATALSVGAAVYYADRERRFRTEAAHLRVETARLNEAFAILNGPDTVTASFGQGARGKVVVNPQRGVLLIASNLPPAAPGKIYEMWIIPKTGQPAPAGLFQSAADDTAMHILRGPVNLASTNAVAVTLENEGGAAQPTSQPLIVAPLAGAGG